MDILIIAFLCITIGSASIPVSFTVNSNPVIVWIGNALGSLISALFVIFIAKRITDDAFKAKISKRRVGKKIVTTFDEGTKNKHVEKSRNFINSHGMRLFGLLCPIFPGALISTSVVYLLDLNKKTYVRWLCVGIFFVSGIYVFGFWWIFIK